MLGSAQWHILKNKGPRRNFYLIFKGPQSNDQLLLAFYSQSGGDCQKIFPCFILTDCQLRRDIFLLNEPFAAIFVKHAAERSYHLIIRFFYSYENLFFADI